MRFVFFGTDKFSTTVLTQLEKAGFVPSAVVTAPDREKGRGLAIVAPETKTWAQSRQIPVMQFEKLDEKATSQLQKLNAELFVVASYGLIIPQAVLDLAPKGALNVHPSLLPKYRGASPIQTSILSGDEKTGVTIMLMDEKMDHGPILRQQEFRMMNNEFRNEIPKATELEKGLAEIGGQLLAEVMPKWIEGEVTPIPQNDSAATYTRKITKADGEIDLSSDPWKNFLKIRAFDGWPGTYFFVEKAGPKTAEHSLQSGKQKIRVIIKDAEYTGGKLALTRVLPEGGKEMGWGEFERGYGKEF